MMRFLLFLCFVYVLSPFALGQKPVPIPHLSQSVPQEVYTLQQLLETNTKPLKDKDEKLDDKLQDFELKLQEYKSDLSWFFTIGALVLGIASLVGGIAIRKWVHDGIEKQVKTITEATLADALADMKRQVQVNSDASVQSLKDLMLQKTADVEALVKAKLEALNQIFATHEAQLRTQLQNAETEIQNALKNAETEIKENANTIMQQTAAEIDARLNPRTK